MVETFALHNEVGHQTQRNVMLLRVGLRRGRLLAKPPVADLTGLQAQRALHRSDDLFNVVADFVVCPYLFGREAEPVGRIVLAAVSHHEHFEAPR